MKSAKLQSLEATISRQEQVLAGLDSTIRDKLSWVMDSITELSPKALARLIDAQETRNVGKYHMVFDPKVVDAFNNTPRRRWIFFKNPRYAAVLLRTKAQVRLQILGSTFFEEQIRVRKAIEELEALKSEYSIELNRIRSESASSGLSLRKPEARSRASGSSAEGASTKNGRQAKPLFDNSPSSSSGRVNESSRRYPENSEIVRDNGILDPFNPFNPLNTLNPLSPWYSSHRDTEDRYRDRDPSLEHQGHRDQCQTDSTTNGDSPGYREAGGCSAPYQDRQEMSTDSDRSATNDSYGSYS